jgi:hypothetical protein
VIVDMHTEARTRSDHPSIMGFCQPQLEGLLEKAVLSRKIPLIRGCGKCAVSNPFSH